MTIDLLRARNSMLYLARLTFTSWLGRTFTALSPLGIAGWLADHPSRLNPLMAIRRDSLASKATNLAGR